MTHSSQSSLRWIRDHWMRHFGPITGPLVLFGILLFLMWGLAAINCRVLPGPSPFTPPCPRDGLVTTLSMGALLTLFGLTWLAVPYLIFGRTVRGGIGVLFAAWMLAVTINHVLVVRRSIGSVGSSYFKEAGIDCASDNSAWILPGAKADRYTYRCGFTALFPRLDDGETKPGWTLRN